MAMCSGDQPGSGVCTTRTSPGRPSPVKKLPQVNVLRRQQFAGAPAEADPSLVENHELRLRRLPIVSGHDRHLAVPLAQPRASRCKTHRESDA